MYSLCVLLVYTYMSQLGWWMHWLDALSVSTHTPDKPKNSQHIQTHSCMELTDIHHHDHGTTHIWYASRHEYRLPKISPGKPAAIGPASLHNMFHGRQPGPPVPKLRNTCHPSECAPCASACRLTRMSVMNHPFSVSSTLHLPSRPRYLTNSVRVSHCVEFMWMWFLSAMNSLYTTLALTRLAGCLQPDMKHTHTGEVSRHFPP
jgi:hypothetical protein